MEEDGNEAKVKRTYCVTGASGYIGSWLVKSLLERGCRVHATLRNPDKASDFLKWWQCGDELRLFRADLHEGGSFDDAVRGCDGVFHVAASMEFGVPSVENLDSYVRSDIVDPAIRGTLNVLRACLRSNSVRRVVYTSSISTLTAKDSSGRWIPIVDESCSTQVQQVLNTKASGWVYVLSKLLTEETALQFAKENGIDLISVITTTVGGPFLTPTVPASIQVLLAPITGDPRLFSILAAVTSRMGSIALVHIDDICNAHMFLMDHPNAEGRYICCTHSCTMSQLVVHLTEAYPSPIMQRCHEEEQVSAPSEISCKKIRELGFNFKYSIQDVVKQSVSQCVDCGFLLSTDDMGRMENAKNTLL